MVTLRNTARTKSVPSRIQKRRRASRTSWRCSIRASRLRRCRWNARWTASGSSIGGTLSSERWRWGLTAIERKIVAALEDGCNSRAASTCSVAYAWQAIPVVAERRFLRVGHKGAAALAPENTIASLAAALEQRVDMIEFDVVDSPDGMLVLAHSHEEIAPGAVSLDQALGFLAREAPASVRVDLDLKWHGFEEDVIAVLRRHDLVDRALVSSFFPHSLRRFRELEPELTTGISYPWDKRGLSTKRALKPFVRTGVAALRSALPYRIASMVAAAGAGAAMLHYSVLSRAAVARCHARGVSVFAWTVDERELLERVLAIGVDGVITNDPRIFEL
jgi:glycerophosphoryl diester phosphodiesterase